MRTKKTARPRSGKPGREQRRGPQAGSQAQGRSACPTIQLGMKASGQKPAVILMNGSVQEPGQHKVNQNPPTPAQSPKPVESREQMHLPQSHSQYLFHEDGSPTSGMPTARHFLAACNWHSGSSQLEPAEFHRLQIANLSLEPSTLQLAAAIHRQALLNATNEVLMELDSAHQPSAMLKLPSTATESLSLALPFRQHRLGRQHSQQAGAHASMDDRKLLQVEQGLAGLCLGLPSDKNGQPGLSCLVEDVGAAVRALWRRMAPQWRHDERGAETQRASSRSSACSARGEAGERREDGEHSVGLEEESGYDRFWNSRAETVLTPYELHECLWRALSEHISPPWVGEAEAAPPTSSRPSARHNAAESTAAGEAVGSEVGAGRSASSACTEGRDEARACTPKRQSAGAELRSEESAESHKASEVEWSELDSAEESEMEEAWEAEEAELAQLREAAALEAQRRTMRLNYDDWQAALDELPAHKAAALRSARLFLGLQLDAHGRAAAHSLYVAAAALTQLCETRLHLATLEPHCGARLLEPELELLVQELVPKLPQLQTQPQLQEGHPFLPFYVAHCVRRLLQELEPIHKRGVTAEDLIDSEVFSELLEHAQATPLTATREQSNWFSLTTAVQLYRHFLLLDSDLDGMLTPLEVRALGADMGVALTRAFCDRLLQVVPTFDAKLDYKGFLDLVIALERRDTPPAMRYFWRVLDLDSRGSVGAFELAFFLRDIMAGLVRNGDEPTAIEHVVDEIIDLVKVSPPKLRRSLHTRPADGAVPSRAAVEMQHRFTCRELLNCGAGGTVISMLIDVAGFWNWDNRESLVAYDEHTDRFAADALRATQRTRLFFSHATRKQRAVQLPPTLRDGARSDLAQTAQEPRVLEELGLLWLRSSTSLKQVASAHSTLTDGSLDTTDAAPRRGVGTAAEGPSGASALAIRGGALIGSADESRCSPPPATSLLSLLSPRTSRSLDCSEPSVSPVSVLVANFEGRQGAQNARLRRPSALGAGGSGASKQHRSAREGERKGADESARESTSPGPQPHANPKAHAPVALYSQLPSAQTSAAHEVQAENTETLASTAARDPHRAAQQGKSCARRPGGAGLSGKLSSQPAILDEFMLDDVLLWLETTAFQQRPARPLAADVTEANCTGEEHGCTISMRREKIRTEIRTLSRSVRSDTLSA